MSADREALFPFLRWVSNSVREWLSSKLNDVADRVAPPDWRDDADPFYDGKICDDGSACMAPNCPCAARRHP